MNDETPHSEQPSSAPIKPKRRILRRLFWLFFWLGLVLTLALGTTYYIKIYPTLPDAAELEDVTYQVPLKIMSQDGKLISEIGTKKRIPLKYFEIPRTMTNAIISAEDENFFEHGGVDFKGIARAVYELITTGSKQSGGSTITMQVARNFFLSKKKSYLRKFNEIVLSYKIEHQISKHQILALYLNKIFLGYRSYGVAAAARTYYDKDLADLSLDEFAMIAGLPKAPSRYNPIYNPTRAKTRRNYVLRRMQENGYISLADMQAAQAVPVHAKLSSANIDIEAGYVAEMARQFALDRFGKEALKNGLTIMTTIDSQLQAVANSAIRDGLQDYEKRHGYRGIIRHLAPTLLTDTEQLLDELDKTEKFGSLEVGVVTQVSAESAQVMMPTEQIITLPLTDLEWAAPYIDTNKTGEKPSAVTQILEAGDVVYLQYWESRWQLAQNPLTEAGLISINPDDGRIFALVGGFDYFKSKFNRVTQAHRQVGSNIKPFLYSSALEKGFTAASIINDAPVVFHDTALEESWRPENYSGRFYGPTRLRNALAHSRNLVSIRLLQQIGIGYAIDYLSRFGFPEDRLRAHRDLSLALGSVQLTPWQVVKGYATFANGGYGIEPYLIDSVTDFNGNILYKAQPLNACKNQCFEGIPNNAPSIITPQNGYIMTSLMQDVINRGSGRKAKVLGRNDIAGKTGTTNDQKDAWFSGFSPDIATTVWVGFDQPKSLGRSEVGGRAALPIWIDYMREALKPYPNAPFAIPEGLVNIPIDPATGQAVLADEPNAFFEVFREANAPVIRDLSEKRIEQMTQELFE